MDLETVTQSEVKSERKNKYIFMHVPSWAHAAPAILLLTQPSTGLCGESHLCHQGLVVNRYCLIPIRTRQPPCSVSLQTMRITFPDVFPCD